MAKLTDSLFLNQQVLTDLDLIVLASKGVIEPFDPEMLSGCSYDLRVGKIIRSRNRGRTYDLQKGDYYVESGECVTFESLEVVDFNEPLLFGYIVNKHSVLAKGLVHPITKIDPGFKGPLAITMFNLGSIAEPIQYEQPLVSLVVVPLSSRPERIYGGSKPASYRQGSLDIASITNEPPEALDDAGLARMYGRPIARLYEMVAALQQSVAGGLLLQDRERRELGMDRRWRFAQAAFGAFVGAALAFLVVWARERVTK